MFKRSSENQQGEEQRKSKRRALVLPIIAGVAAIAVIGGAITAYVTNAWYARNRAVDSLDSGIDTDEAPVSLFISDTGNTIDKAWNVSLSTALGTAQAPAALYPISTTDCTNWYYASAWSRGIFTNNTGWTAGTSADIKQPYATGFTPATVTVAAGTKLGRYDNHLDGNNKVAYVKDEFRVYTNDETLDIYFNPVDPIVITESTANTAQNLISALRIAVLANDQLKFIYAPVAEPNDAHGNCLGVTTNGAYYGVHAEGNADPAVQSLSGVLSGTASTALTNYLSSTVATDGTYSAVTGHTSLGSADDTTGLKITVYVWLEGTDANAKTTVSDAIGNSGTLSVLLNLVGVEPPANNG